MFELIKKLKQKGILFCAASGRQYQSIANMFEPVKDDIYVVAQNGSYVSYRGKDIYVQNMEYEKAMELTRQLLALKNSEVLVNNKLMMYSQSKDEKFLDWMRYGYRNTITRVDDILSLDMEINMVSLYLKENIEEEGAKICEQWKESFNCTLAGVGWLDCLDKRVNKGAAVKALQKSLGILPEETMAFGDGMNDVEMLKAVGESYAMANARQEVKAAAKYIADSNENDGVLKELYRLLEA
jgi:Cof subfamily protein (haloacid dehalogenase superfamily)